MIWSPSWRASSAFEGIHGHDRSAVIRSGEPDPVPGLSTMRTNVGNDDCVVVRTTATGPGGARSVGDASTTHNPKGIEKMKRLKGYGVAIATSAAITAAALSTAGAAAAPVSPGRAGAQLAEPRRRAPVAPRSPREMPSQPAGLNHDEQAAVAPTTGLRAHRLSCPEPVRPGYERLSKTVTYPGGLSPPRTDPWAS